MLRDSIPLHGYHPNKQPMTHKIYELSDNILKTAFIGDVSLDDMDAYLGDVEAILQKHASRGPIYLLVDVSQERHIIIEARQKLIKMTSSEQIANVAIFNASRANKILGDFMMKASKRENLNYFESEADARNWLLATKTNSVPLEDSLF